jgi:alpha-1,3-rhamnosyltransferase
MKLVSIIVCTYNSSEFILETLESAKAQTYERIELIVSDDCSADNTVDLCANWITNNKDRFTRIELLTVPQNTGVSANCNRCIKTAEADWVKFIAGDDILLPDCIASNMSFVADHPEAKAIFSEVLLYHEFFRKENFLWTTPAGYPMNIMDPAFSAQEQYKLLLLSDRITFTPSVFLYKPVLLELGGYDESNKLIEDYPMWLKLTKAGNKLFFFSKPTVAYRRHAAAASNIEQLGLFKPILLKSAAIRRKEVYPHLPWDVVGKEKIILKVSSLFEKMGMNKQTRLNSALYRLGTVYLNPFIYIIYFKKKISKKAQENVFYINN